MDEQALEEEEMKLTLTLLFFKEFDNSVVPWIESLFPSKNMHNLKPHSSQEGTERHWRDGCSH